MITESRKHCGVWQRCSVSRRGIDCITPLPVTTMVSDVGTATPAASCSRSAATQSAMIRWSTSGRAASCSSTPQSSPSAPPAAIAASATRVDSGRVCPPSMTAVTFRYPSPSSSSTCPVYPRAITTRISSTPGAASNAATHRSISVVPPRVSSCFGMPAPSRWPMPPPSTTATIRMCRTLLPPAPLFRRYPGGYSQEQLGPACSSMPRA